MCTLFTNFGVLGLSANSTNIGVFDHAPESRHSTANQKNMSAPGLLCWKTPSALKQGSFQFLKAYENKILGLQKTVACSESGCGEIEKSTFKKQRVFQHNRPEADAGKSLIFHVKVDMNV